MSKLTLRIKDIGSLNRIKIKVRDGEELTPDERSMFLTMLSDLPSETEMLFEKFSLQDDFEIKIFSFDEMMPYLKKWVELFNNLPNQINVFDVHADIVNMMDYSPFWKMNVVVEASFIPSYSLSLRKNSNERTAGLSLLADGSAVFNFYLVEDAESYQELYNFTGSWKEAYLLTVKTLQQGWPQTTFPPEFEQLLKK